MAGPEGGAAPPPRPRVKLNPSRSSSFAVDTNATSQPSAGGGAAASPTVATPRSENPSRKLTLKVHSSQPPTPIDAPPTKTKAGRQPKPSQKVVENKKRPPEEDEDAPLSASHPHKKITIRAGAGGGGGAKAHHSSTQVVVKPKGRPPVHPPGDGYDSEASDRETDPAIEEQIILRLPPGEHADYIRWCIENMKMGVPKKAGGADMDLKFFDEESRRAMLVVKGQPFAAVLVDLPTITEAMKTWDKKSFMKSADICQMLLAFQKVKNEDEAKKAPLPKIIEGNHFKWPHGLTPPMHDAVNRRFAKTISRKEIEDKEAEVERLLAEDAKAASTRWEWLDERQQDGEEEEEEEEEDAEGEVDDSMGYFGDAAGGEDVDMDLEADLEAAFADDFMAGETPAATGGAAAAETPITGTQGGTPEVKQSVEGDIFSEEDEDEDDDDNDDDDDDDDDDDLDEDERAQRDEEQGVKDIISDMQKQLAKRRADYDKTTNNILRSRIDAQIKQLKSEIELKMSSIGIEADD